MQMYTLKLKTSQITTLAAAELARAADVFSVALNLMQSVLGAFIIIRRNPGCGMP